MRAETQQKFGHDFGIRLKVANVILDPRFGGPQNRILQVAERLKRYGVNTVVIIPKKGSDTFYSKLIQKNIQVKKLKLHGLTKHKSHLIGWFIFFVPELISLFRYLKKENFKLVHCNASWQIKGVLAARMARAKTILHLNDTWTPLGIKIVFRILRPFCDGFIVTGKRVKESYFNGCEINVKNIEEIQAPVDSKYFDPKYTETNRTIGNNRGIKIITIANINPTKGLEYFIKMASFLNKKYGDRSMKFYIVGACFDSQKTYLTKLNQLVRNLNVKNLHFYGNSANVPSVLKGADIFVCTSLNESGPMSVWEAMAMEKAIVSTDVGDVKRFIRDGVNGFVVPPRDIERLAEKTSILIQSKELRDKFGKLARTIAVKKLDIQICAQKYKQFYMAFFDTKH